MIEPTQLSENNLLTLDIAVISHNSKVEIDVDSDVHTIHLQQIPISFEDFQKLYYTNKENFIIDEILCKKEENLVYTSFNPEHRTTERGLPFHLFNHIISFYETDLNVSRNSFTPDSLINLTKEINQIQNISDVQCRCVDNSIDWNTLMDMVRDYYTKYNMTKDVNPIKSSYLINNQSIEQFHSIFIINVVFRSPNMLIKPIILKMIYKVYYPENFF